MAIDWSAVGGFTIKNMYYKNIDYRNPTFIGGVPGSNRFIGATAFSGPAFGLAGRADPAWNEDSWFLQMRGNIFIIARASQDLLGVLGIEVNSTRFGEADPALVAPTGGNAGRWNADAIAVQVKTMYIDFKVPELPVWFKAGIQPYLLRNHVFMCLDAAGITARVKIDADPVLINVNPFWAVISHGTRVLGGVTVPTDWTTSDDGNLFGVDINAAIGLIKPGIFFAMQHQPQLYNVGAAEGNRNLWWVGPYIDAKIGPVDLNFDYIYNAGYDYNEGGTINVFDVSNPAPLNLTLLRTYSVKHDAWLLRGQVAYTINKFKFGLGGLYGTGDNLSTPDKFEGYMIPFRSEACKFNEDFLVLTGDWGLRQPYGTTNVGGFFKAWSNTGQGVWYLRGFADYQVTDWLKLKVNAGYIGDTSHGQASEALGVRGGDEFGTDREDDDSIGWEMDAGIQINVYRNLYLDTAFGYLIAGKALAGQFNGFRAQDPWAWATSLSYVF
jgi:hypothetical protein